MQLRISLEITYSSDSTSHKHIEYECRTLALRVVNYNDPNSEPAWTMRSLGIGTSINHTSETQVRGLLERLRDIAKVFNNSPFAKRSQLKFSPDDFAYKLIGTSGDHAADQKKSHDIIRSWRMEVIFRRLGEEALLNMGVNNLVTFLLPIKMAQLEKLGGYGAWEALSTEAKESADMEVVQEVGKRVFDGLPESERKRLSCFIRTGCCMHKDLNTVKAGDREMQESWAAANKRPPMLLANKDNSAVLDMCADPLNPTPAEKRAAESSKRGGSHATMLGGMICRNKDKKKGQQDTYNFYMLKNVGHDVPYPDVSNTRYGSHGEAASTLVVYHDYFLRFMEQVRDRKEKHAFTNIEKNFYSALQDMPTLTELCVLALYNVCISQPFMCYVWSHENIFELHGYFESKAKLLDLIAENPKGWSAPGASHKTATLGGEEWTDWELSVMKKVWQYVPKLTDLDFAIAKFAHGAKIAFCERFSDEFRKGGEVDSLTDEERQKLFFSSTNDQNEGGLGTWRNETRRRPAETLHKFTSSFTAQQNDTEEFVKGKQTSDEDQQYLRQVARQRDASKLQKTLKIAQMKADEEKVEETRRKEGLREERRRDQAAVIAETGNHLVLADSEIDTLTVAKLNKQLDWHREEDQKVVANGGALDDGKVPLKSHMKNKAERVAELKKAVNRYHSRSLSSSSGATVSPSTVQHPNIVQQRSGEEDSFYVSDHEDDLL